MNNEYCRNYQIHPKNRSNINCVGIFNKFYGSMQNNIMKKETMKK